MRTLHPRDVPEQALRAFEEATGVDACCHDLAGILWPFLPPRRFQHLHPPCALVKRHREQACTAFDAQRLRPALERFPQGLLKRCHAGIVEWAVAVPGDRGRPWLVLFAGGRSLGRAPLPELAEPVAAPGPWTGAVARLPPIGAAEADRVLELLRQLAARLDRWRREDLPGLVAVPGSAGRSRRDEIHAWIQARHRDAIRLADLADHLGLSPDRAGHAVAEHCGAGFVVLVNRERLRTAADLLRRTDLPVREVIAASGFRNRAHFHQCFRAAMGVSPARWRKADEGRP